MELQPGTDYRRIPEKISFLSGDPQKAPGAKGHRYHKTIYWIVDYRRVVKGVIEKDADGNYTFLDDEESSAEGFVVNGKQKHSKQLSRQDKDVLIAEFESERRQLIAKYPKQFKDDIAPLPEPRGVELNPRPGGAEGCCWSGGLSVELINDSLHLVDCQSSYAEREDSTGVLSTRMRFRNDSPYPIGPVMFIAVALPERGVLLDPSDGDGDVGSVVFVNEESLGGRAAIEPKETFLADFRIAVQDRAQCAGFAVDVYGAARPRPPAFACPSVELDGPS